MNEPNLEVGTKKSSSKRTGAKLVFFWACGLATGVNLTYILSHLRDEGAMLKEWAILVWLVVTSFFLARNILGEK